MFGSGGVFTPPQLTRFPAYFEDVVEIDAQGRPLMAWTVDGGAAFDNDDLTLAVARLTPAGQLDPTFNPGGPTPGICMVDFSADVRARTSLRRGLAVAPGGQIVALAAIDDGDAPSPRLGFVRLTAAGAYDSGFSGDGRLVVSALGTYSPLPHDLAIDSAGNMLVGGTGYEGCQLLLRLLPPDSVRGPLHAWRRP